MTVNTRKHKVLYISDVSPHHMQTMWCKVIGDILIPL